MSELRPIPVPPRPGDGEDRLDSWKEIAAYLGREVRTVQGWEKNEGLPIHRHQHARQGSVYAYKSELDAWRQARKTISGNALPDDTPPQSHPTRRTMLIAAVVVVVVGILTIAAGLWLAEPALQHLKSAPITSALGRELEPSLSPEGGRVAYTWDGPGQNNFDIYVKLIGPGPPLRLTTDPAKDSSPAWSRDGKSIAFLRQMPDGKARVIVIPSLGGPERQVAEVLAWPEPWHVYPGPHLTWSLDGQGLIVSHRQTTNEPFALYYLSLDQGQFRKLTDPPTYVSGDTAPAISPDGRSLVFRRTIGFASGQLYLVAFDDASELRREPRLLTPQGTSAGSPAWSPDGREIIFSDGYYFEPNLSRLILPRLGNATPKEESLGTLGSFVTTAATSPRLVYTVFRLDSNIWEIQLDGGAPRSTELNLLSSTRIDSGAQFSPDGRRIAFHSQRTGGAEIWIADRDGKNAFQLTSMGDAAAPRWSPDGSKIAFLARYKGLEKIYVMRSSGGEPRQVTTGIGRDHIPSWSRDGRFLYFRSSRTGAYQIWKVSAEGGPETQITKTGGDLTLEGEDGTLYYSKGSGDGWSLWKISGGVESQVLESIYPMTNFFVAKSGVYFTPHPNADGSTAVQLYRFASGKVETIAALPKPLWFGLSVSPDERSILYSQVDHEESNLMLVERLR